MSTPKTSRKSSSNKWSSVSLSSTPKKSVFGQKVNTVLKEVGLKKSTTPFQNRKIHTPPISFRKRMKRTLKKYGMAKSTPVTLKTPIMNRVKRQVKKMRNGVVKRLKPRQKTMS